MNTTRFVTPVLVLLLAPWYAFGVEPWADQKLPVRDGLELWLDASRASGAEKANPKLAKWFDASGRGRHVTQSVADARPSRLAAGGVAVVRFDGLDDHLRAVKQGTQLESFSVFVVVAPRQNRAAFSGILAFNAAAQRDYESGLNIDFGGTATPRFTVLNAEGRGFGGLKNLRTAEGPFGELVTIELSSDVKSKSVRLAVNGKDEGNRPRDGAAISMDEITVGARFYNNAPGNQIAAGFTRCDIAEVLVYNRSLAADERKSVQSYLDAKYAALRKALPPDTDGQGETLVLVKDPPPVQVLLPGFTVRQLPLDLPNVNNVKYRSDGTCVALGYNGDIWLLRDTDGDGLEDKAELFWESKGRLRAPIGMDLTPPGYKLGHGVFVASKGKISLIVDTDNDGKVDKDILVAGGWEEIKNNVDALGVALDPKDGSVYYGRGTRDYANGYLVDKDGKGHVDLKSEMGTIIRVVPDFQSREIVATGIRFPVGLHFNKHGDLFATDQEGATWLPNGNPFDELLHIQKGRHYGFPPRHPKHLPNVIDEPSVFDFGPQHQSTCGFCFNEPVKPGGPTFGPKAWEGDAIVTGESRGKLYRTQLVKTASGYVARNHLFACLNMLTVDCCVATDGSLVVACHSGGPDWGSGPSGKGKLFKITYADPDHPQPVLVWPAGPREVRVEFDRPVAPELLRDAVAKTKITAGKFARAGDRFESLWPGYAVVQAEKVSPRFDVPVRSAQLTPDRRTLILATDPLSAAVHYAITLPGMGRPTTLAKGALPQHPQIDLDFDLTGCDVVWKPKEGPEWSGWLPTLDFQVARAWTADSAPHAAFWKGLEKSGDLTLKAQLNLTDMLRPTVQPGSTLDYQLPAETVSIHLASSEAASVAGAPEPVFLMQGGGPQTTGFFNVKPKRGEPTPITMMLNVTNFGPGKVHHAVSFSTNENKNSMRAIPLHRMILPWADTKPAAFGQATVAVKVPELDGGSWARGRKVFFSEQAACAKCHALHGVGETIGPDLSNLIHRDYASVYRDITQPSFAINPDHLTYTVHLKDGRTLTGVVQTVGAKLRIADTKGVVTVVEKADVDSQKPSPLSTMPDDVAKQLGPERIRDLMTFLLTSPVSMPNDYAGSGPRPKPRTIAEVNAALAGAPHPPEKTRPIRVVLVAGPKDHGPGEHDYPAWQKAWEQLLGAADNVEIATAWEWPAKAEFQKADVMIFFQRGDWTAARAADLDAFLERGGGAVYLHWAVDGRGDVPGFAKRIGLAAQGGKIKFRHGPLDLTFHHETKHPVLRNFTKLSLVDESYWEMIGDLPANRVLGTAIEDKAPRPLFWSLEQGRGRVFVSIPGHYSWTFDDPLFRVLLLRGIAWTAKEPVDRFNDLIWPGAMVAK